MALMRWDPWGELALLQRDVNELLGRSLGQPARRMASLVPPIDAYQTEAGLVIRMELPGIRPEDVEISVADGQLTVSGERRFDDKVDESQWVRRERAVGQFERGFTLPKGTDAAQITASFENGVLDLTIPHPPERQPRKIQISADQPSGQQAVEVTGSTPTSGQQG
ncbi:MAG: Hsp20/alpha crystallin family protein [Egibacteraceae bacterium]